MKIIHVVESLGRGGLERMVLDLTKSQMENGDHCIIVCLFASGELFSEAESKNIECHVLNKKNGIDFNALYSLRKLIKRTKPDIVHTHNAVANYYVYYSTLGLSVRRLICTRHGMGAKNPNSKREKHFVKTLRKTDYVVAVCEAAKNKFIEDNTVPANKCVVICNGIEVANFKSIALDREFKDYKTCKITIGSIGRLNWAKDFFTLLDSFKILYSKYQNIELIIAGGGSLEDDLRSYSSELGLQDAVRFLGDTDDVKPVLEEIDIFVSSSVSEGYSIALLEACASGIPIVATNVGGNSEIVQNGFNGLLVEEKNAKDLASAVEMLILDHEMRQKYSFSTTKWASINADTGTMSKKYNKIYLD